MRFQDFFRFGVINLSRRKARTMLTALSMAIGVMCIIVLISVGIGYEKSYEETIQSMGSLTKIDVTPSTDERGAQALLNDKAVDAMKKLDSVDAVTPVVQATAYLKSGKFSLLRKEPCQGRDFGSSRRSCLRMTWQHPSQIPIRTGQTPWMRMEIPMWTPGAEISA